MNTKERILIAALELFSKNGYEAVSVGMLADSLNITKAALYKHYNNKRDIFDSIVKRMEQQDYENASRFDMPADILEKLPEAYHNTKLSQLIGFTVAQFLYWTEDAFASRFRRMLTVEQYKDKEMSRLYRQYLGEGPLSYTEALLNELLGKRFDRQMIKLLALEFFAPVYMLICIYDGLESKSQAADILKNHMEDFTFRMNDLLNYNNTTTSYPRSEKYSTPELMSMIMGPNPIKLEEELLENCRIQPDSTVCDLGSGTGLTSVFMAKEYGFKVYATDLWSDPTENALFFSTQGIDADRIIPVKADALSLPFDKDFFDAVVSVDSYNYFGRDKSYLSEKLLPFVKSGGYIYIAIPGMKKDCHDKLPPELLLSWSPEQLDFMHDVAYWREIVEAAPEAEVLCVEEMKSNKEVWDDWLMQDNQYAVGDRKSMEAGGGKYINFIKIVLRKK